LIHGLDDWQIDVQDYSSEFLTYCATLKKSKVQFLTLIVSHHRLSSFHNFVHADAKEL